MCSKDKFNTTPEILQLEIRCFGDNTKNYFEIMVLNIKIKLIIIKISIGT